MASSNKKIFYFFELFIILILIGVIIYLILPKFAKPMESARLLKVQEDFKVLSKELNQYKERYGAYPTTEEGLLALTYDSENDVFLPRLVPIDPWGRPYQYISPGINNPLTYDLFTYGPIEPPGTEERQIFIGNW